MMATGTGAFLSEDEVLLSEVVCARQLDLKVDYVPLGRAAFDEGIAAAVPDVELTTSVVRPRRA
jgi:hypothetical protein